MLLDLCTQRCGTASHQLRGGNDGEKRVKCTEAIDDHLNDGRPLCRCLYVRRHGDRQTSEDFPGKRVDRGGDGIACTWQQPAEGEQRTDWGVDPINISTASRTALKKAHTHTHTHTHTHSLSLSLSAIFLVSRACRRTPRVLERSLGGCGRREWPMGAARARWARCVSTGESPAGLGRARRDSRVETRASLAVEGVDRAPPLAAFSLLSRQESKHVGTCVIIRISSVQRSNFQSMFCIQPCLSNSVQVFVHQGSRWCSRKILVRFLRLPQIFSPPKSARSSPPPANPASSKSGCPPDCSTTVRGHSGSPHRHRSGVDSAGQPHTFPASTDPWFQSGYPAVSPSSPSTARPLPSVHTTRTRDHVD